MNIKTKILAKFPFNFIPNHPLISSSLLGKDGIKRNEYTDFQPIELFD